MELHPKALAWRLAAALVATLAPVAAGAQGLAGGSGLRYGLPPDSQWQVRLGASAAPRGPWPSFQPAGRSLSLLGDYYLPRAFGLRATGGLMPGRGSAPTLWPMREHSLALRPVAGLDSRHDEAGASDTGLAPGAAPYLGLGYTGSAAGGSLGLFADLGLRGLKPRSRVRLGGTGGEIWRNEYESAGWRLRDWNLEPVLQLGVSYAF